MKHIYNFIPFVSVPVLYVEIRASIEEMCDVDHKLCSTKITSPTLNYILT